MEVAWMVSNAHIKDTLTMYTAITQIVTITLEHAGDYKGIKPIFLGASLGGNDV
jgi:hypothetical protein